MKVAIYARVSSDRQDVDLSISAQLKALREYAARNDYTVVREFIDEAETGRSSMRPAFREMISLARRTQKPFDLVPRTREKIGQPCLIPPGLRRVVKDFNHPKTCKGQRCKIERNDLDDPPPPIPA